MAKFSDFDLFKMDTLIQSVKQRALFLINFGGEHGAVLAAKTESGGVLPMARLLSDEEIAGLPAPSEETEVVEMRDD
jgi:hypothetical protein